VVSYQNNGQEFVHYDYASSAGATIRFGDGEFGLEPARKTVFLVHYRYGGGKASNLAPDTIIAFDQSDPNLVFIESLTNPLPASGGEDPETPDEIRQSAPQAFREITYRAVTTPDYAEAAERLSWVQKAGATLRWTGSWLTVFVTPDPLNAVQMTDLWRDDLEDQLNRFRQAGRETHTLDPVYADIDLEIELCIAEEAFAGEVKERVTEALFGKGTVIRKPGFFSSNRFTFGTKLERSSLEAVIQNVPGVKAVESICFRRRGVFDWKIFSEYFYDPGMNTIIRIENDPLHPERGTLKLSTHGGR
jgi:predicted phage baseplate assembly protein